MEKFRSSFVDDEEVTYGILVVIYLPPVPPKVSILLDFKICFLPLLKRALLARGRELSVELVAAHTADNSLPYAALKLVYNRPQALLHGYANVYHSDGRPGGVGYGVVSGELPLKDFPLKFLVKVIGWPWLGALAGWWRQVTHFRVALLIIRIEELLQP